MAPCEKILFFGRPLKKIVVYKSDDLFLRFPQKTGQITPSFSKAIFKCTPAFIIKKISFPSTQYPFCALNKMNIQILLSFKNNRCATSLHFAHWMNEGVTPSPPPPLATALPLPPPKIIYFFKFRLKRAWNYAYLAHQYTIFLCKGAAVPLQPLRGGGGGCKGEVWI